ADNLLAAIEGSKERPLSRVLFGLGIRLVGAEVARELAQATSSLDRLASLTKEELLEIPTVGEKIAQSILDYFADEDNQQLIQELKEVGVRLELPAEGDLAEQVLEGHTFVVTGRLEAFSRSEIEGLLRNLGANVTGSVSKKTSYLVAGPGGGSKLTRAQELGIPVLSEQELMDFLGERGVQLD
ncbi:MAG: NAD-dependent DNA ligase LigA, partial [Firmicutes bacterium]|nr:NAD-dependent DNA ligase LigA [Bacillota bacterium]